MTENKQSNAIPSFWQFKAKLKNNKIVSGWQEINRDYNRGNIEIIGFFYNNKYVGTIELKDPIQRHILVRRVKTEVTESLEALRQTITWLIGWQSTIEGKNVKAILELHQNGEIVMKNSGR